MHSGFFFNYLKCLRKANLLLRKHQTSVISSPLWTLPTWANSSTSQQESCTSSKSWSRTSPVPSKRKRCQLCKYSFLAVYRFILVPKHSVDCVTAGCNQVSFNWMQAPTEDGSSLAIYYLKISNRRETLILTLYVTEHWTRSLPCNWKIEQRSPAARVVQGPYLHSIL